MRQEEQTPPQETLPALAGDEHAVPLRSVVKPKVAGRVRFWLREALSALVWAYAITKLFAFDIDLAFAQAVSPILVGLYRYRFIALITLLALTWLLTKSRQLVLWGLYVLFYPFILLFWRVPAFVLKQRSWSFFLALLNTAISFVRSLKFTFVTGAVYLLAMVLVFASSNRILVSLATVALLVVFLTVYVMRGVVAFRRNGVFLALRRITEWVRAKAAARFEVAADIRDLPTESLNEAQIQKWSGSLENSVLFNRACLFAAKKLRNYQDSVFPLFSSISTVLLMAALIVISFAVMNLGLFKVSPGLFTHTETPSFLHFIYYSFNKLYNGSIPEITPAGLLSRISSVLEVFFALFTAVILVSLLIPARGKRLSRELNETVEALRRHGGEMELFICKEYRLKSMAEALAALQRAKTGLVQFIIMMSDSIT